MSAVHAKISAAEIRRRLGHPVIDTDGHLIEYMPMMLDYIKARSGAKVLERLKDAFAGTFANPNWQSMTPEARNFHRLSRPTYRGVPAKNSRDFASSLLPKLMYERLDELGIDYMVLYPGIGLQVVNMPDEEVRRASARALNDMKADLYGEFSDRLTTAAVIPMHTPEEAIEELEYCVRKRGFKVAMVASYVRRPVPEVASKFPEAARHAYWLDTFGLDSPFDYDPVWAKCLELGIAPTFHSLGYGWGTRSSPSNYCSNHLGNFAASAEAVCRSIVMGGIASRFPDLRFGFMEGGVSWARTLYSDLIGHWDKRNPVAIRDLDPASINKDVFKEMIRKYGGKVTGNPDEALEAYIDLFRAAEDPKFEDDFQKSGIKHPRDIARMFSEQFYFGCEGDDPLNRGAFDTKGIYGGISFPILFGSDFGHWDVPEMSEVMEEVHELLEDGLMTEQQLRAFLYDNPMRFLTAGNKKFFEGTILQEQARKFTAGASKK